MKDVALKMLERAKELLEKGEVARVIGWKKGDFCHDAAPASFETVEELNDFVYDWFCGANLSKYLIQASKKEGKTAVFLKPCDTYSFNQLVKEHRINKDNVYVIGVECQGKLDNYVLDEKDITAVTEAFYDGDKAVFGTAYGKKEAEKSEVLLEKCRTCKGKKFAYSDEEIVLHEMKEESEDRFSKVKELESLTSEERFAFWKSELSKCIRCNACRNVCPACSCIKCVFDNPSSGVSAKANTVSFEEQLFHVIRAFHVSGRCTDCGECSRVCPERIPLHLLNRKFIKDIDGFYGEYQAGEESEGKTPLTSYTVSDVEPTQIFNEGDKK